MKVGEVLANKGVLGRFAIDFVVSRSHEQWTSHAIEINLRRGGTTHPFLTLQFLTDGRYHAESSRFLTPNGDERHLVATDHFEDQSLMGLHIADLFDLVAISGIHYDQARERGVVFHMMSGMTELGRVGLTAVGATREEAEERYADAEGRLRDEAASGDGTARRLVMCTGRAGPMARPGVRRPAGRPCSPADQSNRPELMSRTVRARSAASAAAPRRRHRARAAARSRSGGMSLRSCTPTPTFPGRPCGSGGDGGTGLGDCDEVEP
jgi:hypothetical protein